jgi:hypothetical protein
MRWRCMSRRAMAAPSATTTTPSRISDSGRTSPGSRSEPSRLMSSRSREKHLVARRRFYFPPPARERSGRRCRGPASPRRRRHSSGPVGHAAGQTTRLSDRGLLSRYIGSRPRIRSGTLLGASRFSSSNSRTRARNCFRSISSRCPLCSSSISCQARNTARPVASASISCGMPW